MRRAVLDTNVFVSGLLNPAGPPGALLNAISSGDLTPVYSDPVFEEYVEVLLRPELRLDPHPVLELLLLLGQTGERVAPPADILGSLSADAFPDADDRPFYAAALAGACPLVTGNLRHYPKRGPVEVLAPARAVERLARMR